MIGHIEGLAVGRVRKHHRVVILELGVPSLMTSDMLCDSVTGPIS